MYENYINISLGILLKLYWKKLNYQNVLLYFLLSKKQNTESCS